MDTDAWFSYIVHKIILWLPFLDMTVEWNHSVCRLGSLVYRKHVVEVHLLDQSQKCLKWRSVYFYAWIIWIRSRILYMPKIRLTALTWVERHIFLAKMAFWSGLKIYIVFILPSWHPKYSVSFTIALNLIRALRSQDVAFFHRHSNEQCYWD